MTDLSGIWLPHTVYHPIERIVHGERSETKFVVVHVNDGSNDGTLTWWAEGGHEADGAHLQIAKDGTAYQCAELSRLCWHAGAANPVSVGIEHEGWGSDSYRQWVEGPQLHVSANRCAWIHHQYNLGRPRWLHTVFPHGFGGDSWGGHPDCPGAHFPVSHYMRLVTHAYFTHWGRGAR